MTTPPIDRIRNFSVVAHIDHGKSTLSDRLIQVTGGLTAREMSAQVLDNMDIEKERGITIKAQTVRLNYRAKDGLDYVLNLMDTPGHVDFAYEVSRSLAACEGSLLVVDASQGVEAQTLANVYQAIDNNHEIVPVLNKIDLPAAEPERVREQIEDVIGIDASEAVLCSAKSGIGIEEVLEAIVTRLPAPKGDPNAPLKALLVDAWYDPYLGVVVLVRVFDGTLKAGQRIKMMQHGSTHLVDRVGVFLPKNTPVESLGPGEIGFFTAQIKEVADAAVGDTITDEKKPTAEALKGFKDVQSVVFCGLFPVDAADFEDLRAAIGRLRLNDASFTFEMESSAALGFGFRCGFLGLLHMEIVRERLEREYNLELLITAPSVEYQVLRTDGEILTVSNPSEMPDLGLIASIEEPIVQISVIAPTRYIGTIMDLVTTRRGIFDAMEYLDPTRVVLKYKMPLAEIVIDFYDMLKSRTQGYASLDYTLAGYLDADLVKLDLLVNQASVDALSLIVHRDFAYQRGKDLVERLRQLIPRQMFEVPIQAAIGSKVIARETVRAMRKDVLSKCYGGDISRKRKLLDKQKEGKKRMKMVGNVEIPQEAFMAILSLNDEPATER